ncbi:drebrin-like protein A [Pollicipes pollicipes]|uniref:drebrin-like protein A n=1 Tax=Pollicipes pollicipes TaxID=41117 RepID=UPI001884B72C|nr:drebrin-like protein A [Pollicipes pollicipes]
MSIDLRTHEAKLVAAWKDVTDDKTATDWALFGYDGHSNTLKVVSTGDGGLTELSEDLNSNQIMYGFCRMMDPKTSLPKYVLINWQGEGAPMTRKGSCTNHMRDVAALLHGHHVTVQARDEDEVDEEAILEKLARAGSSVYNFRQRSTETSPQTKPVGSNYRRIVPAAEIDLSARDRFWEQQEQEERQRQQEELRRAGDEKARLETERNRREMDEARSREHQALERSRSINEARQAERKAERVLSQSDQEAARWQEHREQDRLDEEERKHRADRLRMERKQEAQQLIGHRTGAARAVFESHTAAGQLTSPTSPVGGASGGVARRWPPVAASHSTDQQSTAGRLPPAHQNGSSTAPVANGHQRSGGGPQPEPEPEQRGAPDGGLLTGEVQITTVTGELASVAISPEHGLCAQALYDYQAVDETEITFDPGDIVTNIEQIDEGWWQGVSPAGQFGLFPANYVQLINA